MIPKKDDEEGEVSQEAGGACNALEEAKQSEPQAVPIDEAYTKEEYQISNLESNRYHDPLRKSKEDDKLVVWELH